MARKSVIFKGCSQCRESKPLSEFYRRSRSIDGYQASCKVCTDAAILRANGKRHLVDADGNKLCTACKTAKPLSEFYNNRRYPDGKHHVCAECMKISQGRYRANVREADLERPHVRRFGPTKLATWFYDAAVNAQGGGCAICGRKTNIAGRNFAADHDHGTGEIRGFLCSPCNQGIGLLRDSPEVLRRAAAYLENPPLQQLGLASSKTEAKTSG